MDKINHSNKTAGLIFVTVMLLFLLNPLTGAAADIWVSPTGNDANAGTKSSPLKSLSMAIRKARELRRLNDPSIKGGITIYVKGGNYSLYRPVQLRPEDSGTEESPTIIKAAPGEHPVLSGGVSINRWHKPTASVEGLPAAARGHVWVADVPRFNGNELNFRQLWVNGQKAVRARQYDLDHLKRILSIDEKDEAFWIPASDAKILSSEAPMEMMIHQMWAIAFLRVKSMQQQGDSTKVSFYQPESKIEFEHPWPPPVMSEKNGNSAYLLMNSMQFLDQPGEWYLDVQHQKVYYWPRNGESPAETKAVAPALNTLVKVSGSLDRPVSHVRFQGIQFKYTTWMRPSRKGHVPLQAGMYLKDAYKLKEPGTPDKASLENQAWIGRQPAAVEIKNAEHISFSRCLFEHTAATGLDFITGVHQSEVTGSVFKDIGGTGIQAGFFGSDQFEAHLPYDPSDGRKVCHHINISNNLVADATNEDWGCVGIGVGYAHDITIVHNELRNLNYSGISVGWGWTSTVNVMKNNRIHANWIHHFAKEMYDVGGVYTLSAQPNTLIDENRIEDLEKAPYAHLPNHYQYIYFDEGSSYIRAVDNWTEKDKFFSNTPGPGNKWENNGPQVSKDIKNKAGLEPEYRDLESEVDEQ